MKFTRNFCNILIKIFLKGLCLLNSTKELPKIYYFVLCLDKFTFDNLKKLNIDNVKLIHLPKLEDSELLKLNIIEI